MWGFASEKHYPRLSIFEKFSQESTWRATWREPTFSNILLSRNELDNQELVIEKKLDNLKKVNIRKNCL
jgi:hypothetical protein